MSVIRRGQDEKFHIPRDGSHRWLSPDLDRWSDAQWTAMVREHMEAHRTGVTAQDPARRRKPDNPQRAP